MAADKRMLVDAYDRSDLVKLASAICLPATTRSTPPPAQKAEGGLRQPRPIAVSNQFVNIHLVLENRPSALVIPSSASERHSGQLRLVIDSNADGSVAARVQPVKVALTEGQFTILDSGLTPGQNVVVDGADRLRSGQAVTVTAARQQPAAPAQTPSFQHSNKANP